MGSHPYVYFVPYRDDFQQALEELREREFAAGRYNPVMMFPPCPVDERTPPGPGAQHDSIQEAMEAADADGTRSILDIEFVGDDPDFGIARRLTDDDLEALFETTTPTRAQVLDVVPMEEVERGEAVCLPFYDSRGQPAGICFAGYSCD
jgi:hypothetical protein